MSNIQIICFKTVYKKHQIKETLLDKAILELLRKLKLMLQLISMVNMFNGKLKKTHKKKLILDNTHFL